MSTNIPVGATVIESKGVTVGPFIGINFGSGLRVTDQGQMALVDVVDGDTLFTNLTRPLASTLLAGQSIWNTDDNAPNFSDGANWRDAAGNLI